MTDADPRLVTPPLGRTRLAPPADGVRHVLTAHRETDTHTALTRGVREYLEGMDITWDGGRVSRFAQVFDSWAAPEDIAEFPTAVVYALEPGRYDAADFTPQTVMVGDPKLRLALRSSSELVLKLTVEVWTTDTLERMALAALLEDAVDPEDGMTGFILELPHYHNARAQFEVTNVQYVENAQNAQQRRRIVIFALDASVPKYTLARHVAPFRPRIKVEVSGPSEGGASG